MDAKLLAGSANAPLAGAVADRLGLSLARRLLGRFPDGEAHVEVDEDLRAADVYVVQPTGPPVAEHLLELVLMADACRRAGAARVTGVVPYFGYARQDRRQTGREPLGARVAADVLQAGGVGHVVAVDLHTPAVEGCFAVPLEHLTAVPLLADAVRDRLGESPVIVSPDLGGVERAERCAALLGLPVAIVHKARLAGGAVRVRAVAGEVRGRSPLVVDDMVTTGATAAAALEALLEAGCRPEATIAVTHALLVEDAVERLRRLPVRRLVTTDSLPLVAALPFAVETVSLAGLLAETVRRLHAGPPPAGRRGPDAGPQIR